MAERLCLFMWINMAWVDIPKTISECIIAKVYHAFVVKLKLKNLS